ncbi:hypothetical protein M5K25_006627 [Dendrobium thyrsiflorum]|uniref:Transmembrane protein n=1 Tax=Dendrobium thyrsiflorum TaxID=117978 RepID=A0ABD0VJA4_DENTH
MIRSASSFFFLLVLLFSCTVMAASEYIINGELGMSLAAKKATKAQAFWVQCSRFVYGHPFASYWLNVFFFPSNIRL